jgi:nitrate reductase gamma subunit
MKSLLTAKCANYAKVLDGIKIAFSMHARLSASYLLVFEFARAFNQLKPIAGRTGALLIA